MVKKYFNVFFAVGLCLGMHSCSIFSEKKQEKKQEKQIVKVYERGFDLSHYDVIYSNVERGQTLASLLQEKGVSAVSVEEIAQKMKQYLNPKQMKAGDKYGLVFEKGKSDSLKYFIYEPDVTYYLKIKTYKETKVEKISRKVEVKDVELAGVINENLSVDMDQAGVDPRAAYAFSQVFDYTIDFFHLQENDKFKVIYQEKIVDDTIHAGFVAIKAAYMNHKGKDFYAFYYQTDSINKKGGFYDQDGNMMKRMFLKAPLDIFKITSRFGMRYHPVLHRMKNHQGTDYAAPTGTPIRTTASGTVIEASYNSGNGNYVRIRHNATYQTQYLHMSKILVRKGQYVSQGDIIGRVGSTGLATGPHVCYRFWKNGRQIDPLKEAMPNAVPIDKKLKNKYLSYIEPIKAKMDAIQYQSVETDMSQAETPSVIDTVQYMENTNWSN